MSIINNRDVVVETLAFMMLDLDICGNEYRTDIYAYVDSDNDNNVTLDTFANVSGNSWIDDNHITVYSHEPNKDNSIDFCSIDDVSEALNMEKSMLINEVLNSLNSGLDDSDKYDADDISLYDVIEHAYNNYSDKIKSYYEESLRNSIEGYYEAAETLVDDLENKIIMEKSN